MSAVGARPTAARFENAAGAGHLQAEAERVAEYAIDGAAPKFVVRPENAEQTEEIVRIALEEKLGVVACGGRTATGLGMPPASYGVALDMTRVTGIASYDPGDLTVSVNAGMPLAELERVLAEKRQFLPLAVPFFEKATVGGAIAAGLDSPLRQFYGTPRDFMIGAEFVDGTGQRAKSGGRVVKNVTGYDFHKLLNGSLGTLAVITRLNFRTYPVAESRKGFVASFKDETSGLRFTRAVSGSVLTPIVMELLSPECAGLLFEKYAPFASLWPGKQEWTVCTGFEGSEEVCKRYQRELARQARDAAAENAVVLHDEQFAALLELLREAPVTMRDAARQAVVMRFTTLKSQMGDLIRAVRSFAGSSWMKTAALARSGSVLYAVLQPKEGDETALKQVEYFWKSAGSLRGKLEFQGSILFCPTEWKRTLNVWEHVEIDEEMERKVKKAFDPSGIFARGRFAGGM